MGARETRPELRPRWGARGAGAAGRRPAQGAARRSVLSPPAAEEHGPRSFRSRLAATVRRRAAQGRGRAGKLGRTDGAQHRRRDCEVLSGGGVRNTDLVKRIARALAGISVASTERLGIHPDWVEATAFAWLAQRALKRETGNLPAVTGAKGARVLGAIYPA